MATWVSKPLPVWGFDIEARPGPWGGADFTFRHMLSMAAGYDGEGVDYLAPGFKPAKLERFIAPLRTGGILVVGHNAIRYDLPFLNGMLVKLGLRPLSSVLVTDTWAHTVRHGQAYSKSLSNMAERFGVQPKGSMSEFKWERVYERDPQYMDKLRRYNIGDVLTVLELRRELLSRGILKPPRVWTP